MKEHFFPRNVNFHTSDKKFKTITTFFIAANVEERYPLPIFSQFSIFSGKTKIIEKDK
jgi:hypothetical protein